MNKARIDGAVVRGLLWVTRTRVCHDEESWDVGDIPPPPPPPGPGWQAGYALKSSDVSALLKRLYSQPEAERSMFMDVPTPWAALVKAPKDEA